jgi:hypothetical protein
MFHGISIPELLIILLILGFIFKWIFGKDPYPERIISNWDTYFPDLPFSTMDCYASVQEIMKKREIPGIGYFTVDLKEHAGFFGNKRVYLRVMNGPTNFDICAAPYGTGFFVSWWFGEQKLGCLTRILLYVPIVGAYIKAKLEFKSYYILDTQSMFQHATHTAVLESIDTITSEKGLRVLTELERQPVNMRIRTR